jgi:uncharacterized protein YbbC (DUF1343 family)
MAVQKILFGIDSFLNRSSFYQKSRIGFVTNDAALTNKGGLSRLALLKAGFNIVKLFSPEHGLNTKGADGTYQPHIIDPVTRLPVISLYGDKLSPAEDDLSDIDTIVFDIPDVGARFYTYLWSLTYIMEACYAFAKSLIILDRPNPISGDLSLAEGPMLDEKNCSSFIGRWNIPIKHSCTFGELVNYFSILKNIDADIVIIKTENWNRSKSATDNWTFIPTSPAISDIETALLYPGMGLLEGINVNEGRGTKTPFKIFGAPWINSKILLKEFLRLSLPGIKAEPIKYTPIDSLYANERCNGLKLTVIDTNSFHPVLTGLQIIKLVSNFFPGNCEERLYKTVANIAGKGHLDRLTGVLNSFEKIKAGELLTQSYNIDNWKETINPFLIY